MPNLQLPGNPRYQPKNLVDYFGYDNLARRLVDVELAVLRTLGDFDVIPAADTALLTPAIETRLLAITTSEMDKVEREVTKHDIRALVRLMQEIMPPALRRWAHVPLTSYDVIETARTLQFHDAHQGAVIPKTREVIACLRDQALRYADSVQIGRTHGQHALPTTVGFWFATVLGRVLFNAEMSDVYAEGLVGKISGAVGAYNAQIGLGLGEKSGMTFEDCVMDRLNISAAPISTQILPPEPLAYYLYSCLMLSGCLGQFGRDARHLMRTEIGELTEPFEEGQVGSSTMAHKRNPINFENLEGMWLRNKSEFGKVLDTMVSEHQRDLVGSSLMRDFPILIVNLVQQLNTLLRPNKEGVPFLARIRVDEAACRRNLAMQGDRILAEPFYLLLQMYGYEGDAHEFINHTAVPMVGNGAATLFDAIEQQVNIVDLDESLGLAWNRIPRQVKDMLRDPTRYVGRAADKTREVCAMADSYLS